MNADGDSMAALRWPARSEQSDQGPASGASSSPGTGWYGDEAPKTSLPEAPTSGDARVKGGGPLRKCVGGLRRLLTPLMVSSAAALVATAIGMALVSLAGDADGVVGAVPSTVQSGDMGD